MEIAADCVLINGTVGAGKSTTADSLGELLSEVEIPHAVIDLDELRRGWPSPPGDPFNHELELRNLVDVARNYRDAGATKLILAGVIEHREEIARYRVASGSNRLVVCRVRADLDVLRARLTVRHADRDEELRWFLHRVGELEAILDLRALDDFVVDSGVSAPHEIARSIAERVGWPLP